MELLKNNIDWKIWMVTPPPHHPEKKQFFSSKFKSIHTPKATCEKKIKSIQTPGSSSKIYKNDNWKPF